MAVPERQRALGALGSARTHGSRYNTGDMKLAIEISEAQADRLREHAKRLGLQPEDLARAAVADLLGDRDEDFEAATKLVLEKNAELYKRLS